jgi:hypothetical protein
MCTKPFTRDLFATYQIAYGHGPAIDLIAPLIIDALRTIINGRLTLPFSMINLLHSISADAGCQKVSSENPAAAPKDRPA